MSAYDPTSTEGLAEHASERLRMNARGLFTSDLSVNEYLCVEKAGFDPVGLVVGSSIYHVGYQQGNFKQNQELDVLSQAMYHARELAMTRMEEEADQLGADGVVVAVRFNANNRSVRREESFGLHIDAFDPQPEIVGFCVVHKGTSPEQ